MKTSLRLIIYFTIAVGLVHAAADSSNSPVLMWSSETLNHLPDVQLSDSMQTKDFGDRYLQPLTKHSKLNLIAFIQDKLHVDDFTKYADVYTSHSTGGAFKNIKHLMDDHFSLEIPEVIKPHLAFDKIKKAFTGTVHSINNPGELETLQLSNEGQFLLIVNLNGVANAVDQESALQQNDDVIGRVVKHLEKNDIKYSALFTGKSAGGDNEEKEAESEVHTGRHLLADVDKVNDTGIFMNVSNIFIYMRSGQVCLKNETSTSKCDEVIKLVPNKDTASQSKRLNDSVSVKLNFDNPRKVEIEFILVNRTTHWVFNSSTLTVSGAKDSNESTLTNANLTTYDIDLTIPFPYSFHCSGFKLALNTLSNKDLAKFKGTYVLLDGFQLQAYSISGNKFFLAQDCVGFFTTGIWMGLFPIAILVAILIGGTMMLLSLSVTDRFDDPKKKTITVNISE